ncbi:hypothetical protein B0J13DRAFT_460411 [Dactylonectria estremocensis]|uniref:Uncharacterized protein n=1 Tax=Dactylonectria estremocensis TaxID=1079267 RepID=A0A9P9IC65_9HYPO|nr:hypothetical protein B0J13DRAFT_460411 [Dactylonectria estremocensis]
MPATVRPSRNAPRVIRKWEFARTDSRFQFTDMCPKEDLKAKCIIQSSFDTVPAANEDIISSTNGFVLGVLKAYNHHHHLILRPDDVWLAILTQLSFFINRHAEALRGLFVAHDGQTDIAVLSSAVLLKQDMGAMAKALAQAVGQNLRADSMHNWIIPDFTTTTDTDVVAASIVMAGAFRSYFNHKFMFYCGIPSVTLLGTHKDWSKLNELLDRILTLTDGMPVGNQPSEELVRFHHLLAPVLGYMARTFDDATDSSIVNFWARMAHESGGSGVHYISGWLTAFCFWDSEGKSLYREPQGGVDVHSSNMDLPGCNIDDTLYHRINTDAIPVGWAGAPIEVNDNGTMYKTMMVAGSMGMHISSSREMLDRSQRECDTITANADGWQVVKRGKIKESVIPRDEGDDLEIGPDTIQPVIGWWMYELETTQGDGDEYWDAANEHDCKLTGLAAILNNT